MHQGEKIDACPHQDEHIAITFPSRSQPAPRYLQILHDFVQSTAAAGYLLLQSASWSPVVCAYWHCTAAFPLYSLQKGPFCPLVQTRKSVGELLESPAQILSQDWNSSSNAGCVRTPGTNDSVQMGVSCNSAELQCKKKFKFSPIAV